MFNFEFMVAPDFRLMSVRIKQTHGQVQHRALEKLAVCFDECHMILMWKQ